MTSQQHYLLAWRHWDGEQVLVHLAIQVENLAHLDVRLLLQWVSTTSQEMTLHSSLTYLSGKGRMSLLPQELACAKEWLRMLELPSHDVVPLIDLGGKP